MQHSLSCNFAFQVGEDDITCRRFVTCYYSTIGIRAMADSPYFISGWESQSVFLTDIYFKWGGMRRKSRIGRLAIIVVVFVVPVVVVVDVAVVVVVVFLLLSTPFHSALLCLLTRRKRDHHRHCYTAVRPLFFSRSEATL